MNPSHYTHVALLRNELGVRTRDPETRTPQFYKIPYQPFTFTPTSRTAATGQWRTLDNQPLYMKRHANIIAYRAYMEEAEKSGRRVYGVINPVQQFMAEHVPVQCGMSLDALRTVFLDIETNSEGGFATPDDPWQPITAITAEVWGHYHVWGLGEFTTTRTDITYTHCADEAGLLKAFLKWWVSDYPDIVTGWNVQFYDIAYIINRINLLHTEHGFKYQGTILSPWNKIGQRTVILLGREQTVIDIVGVSTLDYLEVYRKFSLTQRESYRLDAIAEVELGEKKVAYDEYGSLAKLASQNYQKFIEYNIVDVELVRKLNNKLHHLDLVTQIAYGARVNFPDTFKQVRLWDAMMYYELYAKQIAIPTKEDHAKSANYAGAYVKDPLVGAHTWVVSFDVNSLYPSIMRQWNISPDSHLPVELLREKLDRIDAQHGESDYTPRAEDMTPRAWLQTCSAEDAPVVRWALTRLIHTLESTDIEHMLQDMYTGGDLYPFLRVLAVCITPNKQAFRSDHAGFLPAILSRLYDERKKAKNKETDAKRAAEAATDPADKKRHEQEAVMWGLTQSTRKINLNSCYGAVGNEHFRFFDVRHAEAVTMSGQMIIRYVAHEVNQFLNQQFGTSKDYVLASDTDSIYVTLAPVVKNTPSSQCVDVLDRYCEDTIQPVIDAAFHRIGQWFNTLDNVLAMKREAIAEHGLWTAKKRYLLWVHDNEGVRYNPPKLKITGIEAVRSSTPKYARDVIKKALELFVQGKKDAFYDLIDDAERQFATRPFEDISSPRSCNGLDTYALSEDGEFSLKTPIHVKAALIYNRHLETTNLAHKYPKIRNGEKIRFCYLKKQNPLGATVIAAPHKLPTEWQFDAFLDRNQQFEKSVVSPLENIVSYAQWTVRPIVTLDF